MQTTTVNRPARSKLSPRFHALGDQRDLAVVAVDLGYSSSRSSCGVATSGGAEPKHYTFGDAVTAVATLCNERLAPVLVLEAPLSTSHCDRGNPRIRGGFEKGRGWYWGPGAVTLIAAMQFLKELESRLDVRVPLLLAEAFLSNKARRSLDTDDAVLIAKTKAASALSSSVPHLLAGRAPIWEASQAYRKPG
jgi:hypothetical protein